MNHCFTVAQLVQKSTPLIERHALRGPLAGASMYRAEPYLSGSSLHFSTAPENPENALRTFAVIDPMIKVLLTKMCPA